MSIKSILKKIMGASIALSAGIVATYVAMILFSPMVVLGSALVFTILAGLGALALYLIL